MNQALLEIAIYLAGLACGICIGLVLSEYEKK